VACKTGLHFYLEGLSCFLSPGTWEEATAPYDLTRCSVFKPRLEKKSVGHRHTAHLLLPAVCSWNGTGTWKLKPGTQGETQLLWRQTPSRLAHRAEDTRQPPFCWLTPARNSAPSFRGQHQEGASLDLCSVSGIQVSGSRHGGRWVHSFKPGRFIL
jgi:hypothetical protein